MVVSYLQPPYGLELRPCDHPLYSLLSHFHYRPPPLQKIQPSQRRQKCSRLALFDIYARSVG